ncbi:hypothetical protein ACVDFE_40545 [Lentzea chajnantorensis]
MKSTTSASVIPTGNEMCRRRALAGTLRNSALRTAPCSGPA